MLKNIRLLSSAMEYALIVKKSYLMIYFFHL